MINIGIISPSNIAYKRFLPSLDRIKDFNFIGVAIASKEEWDINNKDICKIIEQEKAKAENFKKDYGGEIFESYKELILNDSIHAVYIPLPPALHYKWAKFALENNKHVLIEKPSTINLDNSLELITLAENKSLALHENYMFQYHSQINAIQEIIKNGILGNIRLYRMTFGFPYRGNNDFRYNKALGGGALLDCGGYPIKLANVLLGNDSNVTSAKLNYTDKHDVDIYGSATITNQNGLTAQISFGMDNFYRCEFEVWGSEGLLRTDRIFTAPSDFIPVIELYNTEGKTIKKLAKDDAFKNSILHFKKCIEDKKIRIETYNEIRTQAAYIEQIKTEG